MSEAKMKKHGVESDDHEDEDGAAAAAGEPAANKGGLEIPKTYSREFHRVVQDADVILEVLDARDPAGCRSELIENAITRSGSRKRLILVLNKADLVPKNILLAWLKYLRREFPTVAFKSGTSHQSRTHRNKAQIHKASAGLLHSSQCLGADTLLNLLANYSRNEEVKTNIIVGVVGFPNVGKSSLINSLKRKKACQVGAVPGMTTSVQTVQLDKHIRLLDCPGLVLASCVAGDHGDDSPQNSNMKAMLALRNCVKVETLEDPVSPVQAIMSRVGIDQLMEHFKIARFENVEELLILVAKRSGHLKKGGVPDTDKAARVILQHWNTGKIKYWTEPPPIPHDSTSALVPELGEEFKLDEEVLEGAMEEKGVSTRVVPSVKFVSAPDVPIMMKEAITSESEDEENPGEKIPEKKKAPATDVAKLAPVSQVRVGKKLEARKEREARLKDDLEMPMLNPTKLNKMNKKRAKKHQKKALKGEEELSDSSKSVDDEADEKAVPEDTTSKAD